MPGGGRLADHLGAAALALLCGCRHPELVLSAGPELRHPETRPAARHLVARVTLLPAVLNLSAMTTNQLNRRLGVYSILGNVDQIDLVQGIPQEAAFGVLDIIFMMTCFKF